MHVEVVVPFPQKVAFLVLKLYLATRLDKIVTLNSPSHIKAELSGLFLENGKVKEELVFGSWRGFLTRKKGNARGIVKASVEDLNSESLVDFKFSFAKHYKPYLILEAVLFIALNSLIGYIAITSSSDLFALFVILNVVLLVFGGFWIFSAFWNTMLTQTTFIEEFEEFCKQVKKKKEVQKN